MNRVRAEKEHGFGYVIACCDLITPYFYDEYGMLLCACVREKKIDDENSVVACE